MDHIDKTLIVILLYFFIMAFLKEREDLGCKNNLQSVLFTSGCDNSEGVLPRKIREKPGEVFKLKNVAVYWRKSFLFISIILLLYTSLILKLSVTDNVKQLFVGVLIGTLLIYFSYNFYEYHQTDYVYNEIEKQFKNCNIK